MHYASWLLTAGIPLLYVSRQLGHAGIAATSRHYARWAGGDEYRPPVPLERGEVPAGVLARLDSHQTPTRGTKAEGAEHANPRPSLENLEHETGFEPATLTLAT